MDTKRLFVSFILIKNRKNKAGQSPIQLRFTIDGKRDFIVTSVSVEPKQWDSVRSRVRGTSELAQSQNNVLHALRNRVYAVYSELFAQGKPITTEAIKAILTGKKERTTTLIAVFEQHNEWLKSRIGKDITKPTHTKYETLKSKVQAFLQYEYNRKDYYLDELSHSFAVKFQQFLSIKESIGHNTTIKYIQFLKKVINYAISMEYLEKDPFKAVKCTLKPVLRESLREDELQKIHELTFTTKRLEQVRDIFIFSCYTGLAYSDVKTLNTSQIVKGIDNKQWINTSRTKTKTRVSVPLLPIAETLVNKYREWRIEANTSLIFPVLSNQKMNAYLKEIADLSGITKMLTFHLARHTFATLTLNNGVPMETVSKMLGHTNVKTTQIYSKVLDNKISADMQKLEERLNKTKDQ